MRFSILAAVAAAVISAQAGTIYVDKSYRGGVSTGTEEAPYTQFVDAVTNAPANSVILVKPGVYKSSVTPYVKKNLTIRSTGGRDVTIIDGENARRCIRCDSALKVTIQGFTLRNGYIGFGQGGGGVLCNGSYNDKALTDPNRPNDNSANILFEDCRFQDCVSTFTGGAVWGGVYVRCIFEGNYMTANNHGTVATEAILINCIVANNYGSATGALVYSCMVVNCSFFNNYATKPIFEACTGKGRGVFNCYIHARRSFMDDSASSFVNCLTDSAIPSTPTKATIVNCSQLPEDAAELACWVSPFAGDFRPLESVGAALLAGDERAYTTNLPSCVSAELRARDFNGAARLDGTSITVGAVQATGGRIDGGRFIVDQKYCPIADAGCYAGWMRIPTDSASMPRRVYAAQDQGAVEFKTVMNDGGTKVFNSYLVGDVMRAGPLSSGHPEKLKLIPPKTGDAMLRPIVGEPVYVDCAAAEDGDGSAAQPFMTLVDAMTAVKTRELARPVVLVARGTYDTGSAAFTGNNRVVMNSEYACLRSLEGAAVTIIKGAADSSAQDGTGLGAAAIRPVAFSETGLVQGFTLRDGRVQNGSAETGTNGGAAVCAESKASSSVLDCEITGCYSAKRGTVAVGGYFERCRMFGNGLPGNTGIALFHSSTVVSCLIESNTQIGYLGAYSPFVNCTIVSNVFWFAVLSSSSCNCIVEGSRTYLRRESETANNSSQLLVMDINTNEASTNSVVGALRPNTAKTDYANAKDLIVGDAQLIADVHGKRAYVKLGSPAVNHGEWQYLRSVYDLDGEEFTLTADGKVNAGCSARVVTTVAATSARRRADGEAVPGLTVSPSGPFAVLEPTDVTFTADTRSSLEFVGFAVDGDLTRTTEPSKTISLAPAADTSTLTTIDVAGVYDLLGMMLIVR